MNKIKRLSIILGVICSIYTTKVGASEYQWSVKLDGYVSDETKSNPDAFLWIPTDCQQVKAIVVSQQNMCEETIFSHPTFRKKMSDLGFAIIWIAPGIDYQWNVKNGCQEIFDKILVDLADVSGYEEIKHAPLVPLGHSAMATFPWNFAAWNPERTLAIISYKGDAPRTNLTGYGRENLEWGRNRNIDGIPGLMIEGEYEWWEARVNPALAFRLMYPQSCVSFLYDRGQGHFDVSDKVVDYICLFLQKAAQYRLPKNQMINKRAELIKVEPKDGWLAQRRDIAQKNRVKTAPFAKYRGNLHDAFWYFDWQIAEATENYYKEQAGKKMQYIGYVMNDKLLPFNQSSHSQYSVVVDLNTDYTFNIAAIFTDSLHREASPAHAAHNIRIEKINGPVRQVNETTFALDFYRMGLNNSRRTSDIWLMAHCPEDNQYKNAIQQLNIRIPYPLNEGERQYILFPGLPDIGKETTQLTLKANSDKSLPVSYYVKEGPAKVDGDKLLIEPIPPRAKYPVKVTVVAWQYGVKGKVQTAEAVERSFYIQKNNK